MQLLNAKDAVFSGQAFALKFYEVCQGENSIYILNRMLCFITHLKNKVLQGTKAKTWDQIPAFNAWTGRADLKNMYNALTESVK